MKIEYELPEGLEAEYEDGVLKISGEGEEVEKRLEHALVDVKIDGDTVVYSTDSNRRNVRSILETYRSHTRNMVEGLQDNHVYRMKGVYAHFPMTIQQQGDEIHIQNFMGEREPRKIDVIEGVDVSVNGDDLELRGPDKEAVSQTAARIEQACYKGDRDPRTFQDGVYIVKGEKE